MARPALKSAIRCSALAIFISLTILASTSFAQTAEGIQEDETQYHEILVDNLNIHYDIPIVSKAGIGLPFRYALHFNNNFYHKGSSDGIYWWSPDDANGGSAMGWVAQSTTPMAGHLQKVITNDATCSGKAGDGFTEYTSYQDPQGNVHQFPWQGPNFRYYVRDDNTLGSCAPPTMTFTLNDNSGITITLNGKVTGQPSIVTFKDGSAGTPGISTTLAGGTLQDANGNTITGTIPGLSQLNIADTLGVQELMTSGAPGSGQVQYQYPTASGTATVYVNYVNYLIETNFGCYGVFEVAANTYRWLVDNIQLPDGSAYKLTYESHFGDGSVTGRLKTIQLPTGATISYQYNGLNYGINCGDGTTNNLTRTTPDGSWTFVRSSNGTNGTTTVTGPPPANNQTVYYFLFDGNANYHQYGELFEVQRIIRQGSSTTLKTIVTCYNGNQANCTTTNPTIPILQKDIYTTLGSMSNSSRVSEVYDSYGNTISLSKYDFGAASPTTITTTSYGSYNSGQCTSVGNSVNNRPCEIIVSDGQHTLSDTRFTYDTKGNLLSKSTWVSGSSWLGTSATYNANGTVNIAYDTKSNSTTYGYNGTGGCNNGFPTSITAGGMTSYATWDCNGAVKTSSTDPNSQVTSYTYADPLWRQTLVSYPDGGSTSTTYAVGGTSISTSTAITGTMNLNKTTNLDGLGRLSQTQLTSDPEGTDYVDTTYDSEGRKATVSNPHRSGSLPTDGIVTYGYDALNRTVSVLQPDSSTQSTTYTNNCTTATDEAGKSRQSCFDGLGRLTSVFEDPGSAPHLNYETDYTYDALGNLLSVTQKGDGTGNRVRSFAYDGLSRLTSATNPESGTITYSYVAVGGALCSGDPKSVCQKIAPSPNQAASGTKTVTTTYTYDTLNRLTSKSYQDSYTGNPATATAKFGYDGVALTGCTTTPPSLTDSYPAGRRTSMCDGSGATSWAHDKMGRIKQERRTIGAVKGDYENDVYNLDGSVATSTALGYSIAYTYNSAGRVQTAKNNADPFDFVTSANYAPFGGLTGMSMGAQPITVSNTYNNRLQPSVLSASTTTATILSLSFDFHSSSHVDNGNVYQIVNNRDTNRTQNFVYDSLNRIQNAYTTGSNWGETYTIDPWGNLTNIARYQSKSQFETLNCAPANTKNQLNTCYSYDAAGNMIQNGTATYTYDAENRQIATAGMSYIYDADGKRVEKCTAGSTPGACATNATGTLYWTGWGNNPLAETDLAGNVLENYIFFNGRRIARREAATKAVHFYFSDHLGTHSLITDANGDMPPQKESDFYPYGGEISVSGTDGNHYKFTGKERDAESGLDYFVARHYAPSFGRFMVPDWSAKPTAVAYAMFADPQTLNRYGYVRNNPLSVRDVDGHCYPWCTVIGGAFVGGLIGGGAEIVAEKWHGESINWKKVEGSAVKGAITGAAIGLAGPEAGVATTAALGAAGNVVGGVADRVIQGQSAKQVLSPKEVTKDAVSGAVGGAIGGANVGETAGEFVANESANVAAASGDQAAADFYSNNASAIGVGVAVGIDFVQSLVDSSLVSNPDDQSNQQQQREQQQQTDEELN